MAEYEWHKRMFCKCGWSTKPAFGDSWYAIQKYPVCPDCGTYFCSSRLMPDQSGYTMKTVRWVEGDVIIVPEWWKFNKQEPGHWEEKGES